MARRKIIESDTEESHTARKSLKQSEENDAATSASKLNFKFIFRIYFSDSLVTGAVETSKQGGHDVIWVFFFFFFSLTILLGKVANPFPLRSSRKGRGKGGAIAQLQAVAKIICTDNNAKKKKATSVLQDVPLNSMAPKDKVKILFLLCNLT